MDLCWALVDVEVADHVHHDEAQEADAGDGHHVLLADGGLVEVERPGKLRCPPRSTGTEWSVPGMVCAIDWCSFVKRPAVHKGTCPLRARAHFS